VGAPFAKFLTANLTAQTIESFWSLLKRGIMGSFHHVTREYLPLYVNEFAFRFNGRDDPDIVLEASSNDVARLSRSPSPR